MIAIPAIDIMHGACVRLLQGDFAQRRNYKASPLDQAKAIEDAGITHLHLVDLDGAKTGEPKNLNVLEVLASGTSLKIDFGGGIRNLASVQLALNAGANQVNIGTFLFQNQHHGAQCIEMFGPEQLIASVDVRHGKVAVHGWQTETEFTAVQALENLMKQGWVYFSVTDVSRDGTMTGVSSDFYEPLVQAFPAARIIGGGGVARYHDLSILRQAGLYAAVTGKAIFENTISLEELVTFNQDTGQKPVKYDLV